MGSKTFDAYATSPNGSTNTNYKGKMVITDTPIAGKNASNVTWAFYMWYTGSGSHAHKYNYGNALTVVIDGKTVIKASNYKAIDLNGTSESKPLLYASQTQEMQHNADGTKTFDFDVKYDQTQAGGSLDYLQIEGSYTNGVISLAGSMNLSNEKMVMGTKVNLSIAQQIASYTHTVKYAVGDKPQVVIEGEKTSKRSLEWEIPVSLAAEYPNSPAVPCTFYLQTYNGDTPVGEMRTYLKMLEVPESIKPEIPDNKVSFSMYSENSLIQENGEYIAGKCSVRAQIAESIAGDEYGATVVSAKLTCGSEEPAVINNVTFPLDISVPVSEAGGMTAALTLTNSRGRRASKECKFTVREYAPPTINALNYYRCDINGTKLSSGQYVKIEGIPSVMNIEGNAAQYTFSYALKGSESFSEPEVFELLPAVLGGGNIASDKAYDIKITISDTVGGTNSYIRDISREKVPFDIKSNGKAVCIGDSAQSLNNECFNMAFAPMIKGEPIADFVIEQGESDGWAYRKWSSGRAEAYKQADTTVNVNTAQGAMYRSDAMNQNLPAGLFVETPQFLMEGSYAASELVFSARSGAGSKETTPNLYIISFTPMTGAIIRTHWAAFGKWK
ncbi:MAG: hypothetical protein KH354_00870 [Clostridiales bacterium]|nr:hypothetical protein [Clostridiales bacterium]